MVTNKKLGKGLSSLLGNKKEDLSINVKDDKGLLLVSIEKIFRDENQPRKEFDSVKINELAVLRFSLLDTKRSENKNNSNSLFKSLNLTIAKGVPLELFFSWIDIIVPATSAELSFPPTKLLKLVTFIFSK